MSIKEEMHKELLNNVSEAVTVAANYAQNEEYMNHIYVCGSYEEGITAADAFYEVNKRIIQVHEIGGRSSDEESDLSSELIEKISDIIGLFRKYKQDVPTQIRIMYSFEKEKVKYDFSYEPYWSDKDDFIDNFFDRDFFNEWRDEIESQLNS